MSKFSEFNMESNEIVSNMVREFEKNKKAQGFQKRSFKKSGILDMSRIANYKFSENIFVKNVIDAKQKNHSLYVMIDWSGSIRYELLSMVKQTIIMAKFARKIGIHFRVFSFNDANPEPIKDENGLIHSNGKILTQCKLVEYLRSGMSSEQFINASENLFIISKILMEGNLQYSSEIMKEYGLCCTPLNEALVLVKQIVLDEKKENKIDNVNVVVITDGASQSINFKTLRDYNINHSYSKTITGLIDPHTNKVYSHNKETFLYEGVRYAYANYTVIETSIIVKSMIDCGISVSGIFITNKYTSTLDTFNELVSGSAMRSKTGSKRKQYSELMLRLRASNDLETGIVTIPKFCNFENFYVIYSQKIFKDVSEITKELDKTTAQKTSAKKLAMGLSKDLSFKNNQKKFASIVAGNIARNLF
jgi:hypothetical protein